MGICSRGFKVCEAFEGVGKAQEMWNWEIKRGPRLGSGAPEGAFRSQRRFHTGCVGSSILASLSEAGGNESSVVTSKPLPPRFVTLRRSIHSKRAHASWYCRKRARRLEAPENLQ